MGARAPASARTGLALAAVLALTTALYAPTLGNGYCYDDEFVARAFTFDGRPNPMIQQRQPWSAYFRAPYWKGESDARPEYRPVTVWSFARTHHAVSKRLPPQWQALPHHAGNVLLHVLATALVWALLGRAGAVPTAALAGALVFGVHAVHSEAVASIVGRSELFGFCFGAGAVLLALLGAERGRAAAALCFAAAAGLLFLAFGSKESALAWAPFLVLMEAVRRRQRPLRRPWSALGPALALGAGVSALPLAAYAWLRTRALATLPEGAPIATAEANPLAHVDTAERLLSAVMLQGVALGKTLLPLQLASDYGHAVFELVATPADARFLAALAVLLGLLALAWASREQRPPLLPIAVATFLGFGFLTSNIPLAIGTIFGERLLYAPSLGLSFAVAWAAGAPPAAAGWRAAAALVLVAWLGVSAVVASGRNAAWRSNERLYVADAAAQPRSVKLNILVSDVYAARGETQAQFDHIARAFALQGETTIAWLRLGGFFQAAGRWDEAAEALRRGLDSIDEDGEQHRFALLWTLAAVERRAGRLEPMRRWLEAALAADPQQLQAHLADLVRLQGQGVDDAWLDALLRRGEALSADPSEWIHYRRLLAQRAAPRDAGTHEQAPEGRAQ